jgi:predicted PurR-regulated permease PerM
MTDPSAAAQLRGQIPRGLIVVLAATGLLVSVLALRQFTEIIAPVLLALILVVGVHPLTGILRRHGAPQWLAATVTLLALVLVIFGLAASLALSVAQLAALIPTYQDSFTALVNDLRAWLASFGVGPDQLQAALGEINFANVAAVVADLLAGMAAVFSNMLFLLFVVVFMAVDATGFSRRLARAKRQRVEVVGALDGFVHGTRSYLLVTTVFGGIVAAIDAGFLWLVGVPLPLLWGLLAFITNYVPNVGFIIGVIPPALLALLEGGPGLMLAVIVAYSVINFIIQSVIQPKILADAVNLSLTLTFLSLVFWAFVIGPIGALLAVPLTLLMKALLLDADPNTRWISDLFEGGPPPPEDEDAADIAADADNDDTPGHTSEVPAGRIAAAADGQGPPSAGTKAKLD